MGNVMEEMQIKREEVAELGTEQLKAELDRLQKENEQLRAEVANQQSLNNALKETIVRNAMLNVGTMQIGG